MTKIGNQNAYNPDVNITGLDYLLGSDADANNKRTKNFRIIDITKFINNYNGQYAFDYLFYSQTNLSNPIPSSGAFFSKLNENNPELVTELYFSKDTESNKDISLFFKELVLNNVFNIKIAQQNDLNSVFYFEVSEVIEHTSYYTVKVNEIYSPTNKILEFNNSSVIVFELKQSTSLLTFDNIVLGLGYVPANVDDISDVGFSNNYNDLDNLPTITDGITNLSYTESPTQGQINSDTGTGAIIPLADDTNAGLTENNFTDSEKTNLSNQSGTNTGDNSPNSNSNSYADGLVVGLLNDRGNYDASSNVFPSSGGSGISGAILKGNMWFVSVAGNLGGEAVSIGDSFRALVNSPAQISSNWSILDANINYVAENEANKTDVITGNETSIIKYLNVKGWVDGIKNTLVNLLPAKATTLVDADLMVIGDSADSFKTKTRTFAQLKTTLQTVWDTIYVPLTRTITINGTPHDLSADRSWTVSSGVTPKIRTLTSADLSTLDIAGFKVYADALSPNLVIASNEIYDFQVTDTGQVFSYKKNSVTIGLGQTGILVGDVLETTPLVVDNIFTNKVLWKANGSASVGVGALALTGVGTASQVVNYGGFDFYLKTASAATAGTTISQKETSLFRILINTGFHYEIRVKQNDASVISDVRFVFGLGSSTAIGNVEPSTIAPQLVAFGADGTDTNNQIIHKQSGVAATKINLGASSPKSQTHDYTVTFMRLKNLSTVYYKVLNNTTGAVLTGSFSANTDALTPIFNKNNNASNISCAFEIQRAVLKIQD